MIFKSAFNPQDATGAFIGGTAGYAFLWGMKRALFSSEAGQGSSPIAHAAAKTKEPVREAVVAGLEPFIDTIVVCTLTALVILSTGAWDRVLAKGKPCCPDAGVRPRSSRESDGTWNIAEPPGDPDPADEVDSRSLVRPPSRQERHREEDHRQGLGRRRQRRSWSPRPVSATSEQTGTRARNRIYGEVAETRRRRLRSRSSESR